MKPRTQNFPRIVVAVVLTACVGDTFLAQPVPAAAASGAAQADRFAGVEMKVTHVSGHIYMLQGAGGNIGVSAGPDGLLIVDDEFAPLADMKAFREMLLQTSAVVRDQIREGESLEQIQSKGLPEKWNTWAAPTLGTRRWIEILYRGLK